jgi:UDP-2,3-diacylglucosamine pyrophosphatase LpxH
MSIPVYIIGDIHGMTDELIDSIKEYDIKDCMLICVGDLGIGFQSSEYKELRGMGYLNRYFAGRNIHFYSIRGNHDNPFYFKGDGRIVMSHYELLDDYTTMNINGEKFLFVGGATSIDRTARKEGISYWKDEPFVLDAEKMQRCDILITHSAPSWIGSAGKEGISGWLDKDEPLWDELVKERKDHDILLKMTQPKKHYCGHFHISESVDIDGCNSKILNELEIVEHRNA